MYNLLVVDDREIFHRMIAQIPYFQSNHNKFCVKNFARNGLEALELLKMGDTDIVLTDIRMPLMNGIDLLKEINKNKLCRCTILLSEHSDFSYAKEGIVNGAFDYIVKPLDDYKLKATFDRAYEYMQCFSEKERFPSSRVSKLAISIIFDDDALFYTKFSGVMEAIKQGNDSFAEMLSIVGDVLEKLNDQISIRLEYADRYIPLGAICSINHPVQSESDLIELLTSKILLLRHELRKFKPVTSCRLVNKICQYIFSDIENIHSLKSISEKVYVNPKYLSTLFKKETGMRYIDFVTYFKIERAKMLLSYSDMKIYTIAEMLGFTDTAYFSKVFKSQTGFLPRFFDWNNYT